MNISLDSAVVELLEQNAASFTVSENTIPLSCPTFDKDEIVDVMKNLCSSKVTMGQHVNEFEREFASYIGSKHAIMVNSGSSANLLVASALLSKRFSKHLNPGDEVICPVVTWPTTIFPFAQLGIKPVLVDVEKETFNIDPTKIVNAITSKTKAICIVPILGNPCQMDMIQNICTEHNLILIEDTCESLGSMYDGKMCGTFGLAGTFSFFFSHHITTIEGGMVVTNDDEFAEILRCQRAHGWTRNLDNKHVYASAHTNIDERFLFIDWGYNLRPMELQAIFGKHQLRKLDTFNSCRIALVKSLREKLSAYANDITFPSTYENAVNTYFGFPMLINSASKYSRSDVVAHLEKHGIDTRPIVGGNLSLQPCFELFSWRKGSEFDNANIIHERGIYFGVHPKMNEKHCEYIAHVFSKLFDNQSE